MKRFPIICPVALAMIGAGTWSSAGADAQPGALADPRGHRDVVKPFLQRHCLACHGPEKQEAKLRLDVLEPDFRGPDSAGRWVEVMDALNRGEMPPPGRPRPADRDVNRVVGWIASELRHAQSAARATGGRVLLRRLTRTEYANTVRDLLHLRFLPGESPQELLPPDGSLDGFDKLSKGLLVDPSLVEAYYDVARRIAERAIVTGPPPAKTAKLRFEFEDTPRHAETAALAVKPWLVVRPDGIELYGQAAATPRLRHPDHGTMVPVKGWYSVRVRAAAANARPGKPPVMKVWRPQTGETIFQVNVDATRDRPKVYEVTRPLSPEGASGLAVILENGTSFGLANLYWHEMQGQITKAATTGDLRTAGRLRAQRRAEGAASQSSPNPATLRKEGLPHLFLDYLEVEGPLYDGWPPRSHQQLFFAGPDAKQDLDYARRIFARFLPRAYRRKVTAEELVAVVNVVAAELHNGETFEEAVKAGLTAVLCSPSFLYLLEPQPQEAARPLTGAELASRLSYFLWSSMPDDELFRLAEAGKLRDPAVLDAQVDRMLADPRAEALVQDFAAQWLKVREFDRFTPDHELYPVYFTPENAPLGEDLKAEPLAFFREVVRKDLPLTNFLDSDWTMLNERLARFYGIPGVQGEQFRRVTLPAGSHRGGLVAMAGVHRWGSDGNRTKPVERAKYVLDVLFNERPDPPPANVGEVEPNVTGKVLTVRQRLEKHRQIASCAACHRKLDPYGLALENFSAIGLWRDRQDGEQRNWGDAPRIDAGGELPNGRKFSGPAEFKQALREQGDRFLRGLAEKTFAYALGRGVEPADRPAIDRLVAAMGRDGATFRGLFKGIVRTEAFQTK